MRATDYCGREGEASVTPEATFAAAEVATAEEATATPGGIDGGGSDREVAKWVADFCAVLRKRSAGPAQVSR